MVALMIMLDICSLPEHNFSAKHIVLHGIKPKRTLSQPALKDDRCCWRGLLCSWCFFPVEEVLLY